MMGNEHFLLMERGSIFYYQKGRGKEDSGRCGAGKARRDTRVSGKQESPFRELLEQVRGNVDFGGGSENHAERLHRKQGTADGKGSKKDAERRRSRQNGTREKMREAYEKVCDRGNWDVFGYCAGNIEKKVTDFLRRISAPVSGVRGVTLSYVCPHCKQFPHVGGLTCGGYLRKHGDGSKKKKRALQAGGGAVCVEANMKRRAPKQDSGCAAWHK